mgnify:CR=1 FL=1
MKKNILIAGSSGAIGKEFTRFYSDDPNVDKIITLSRKISNFDHKKIQYSQQKSPICFNSFVSTTLCLL